MPNSRVYWLHTLTPTHAGVGRGVGYIDLPIERDVVTNWPLIRGSLAHVVNDRHHSRGRFIDAVLWGTFWATLYVLPLALVTWAAHLTWQQHHGLDPGVIGSVFVIDGTPITASGHRAIGIFWRHTTQRSTGLLGSPIDRAGSLGPPDQPVA